MSVYKWIPCGACNGTGWELPGFNAPSEDFCAECGGNQRLVVYVNDAIAKWPGGPFLGSERGLYRRANHYER